MPLLYAVKHVFRSWKLFLALLIGIVLASTFFAGVDIKANATARQALDQKLSQVYVDMVASGRGLLDPTLTPTAKDSILHIGGVKNVEIVSGGEGSTTFGEDATGPTYYVRTVGIENNSIVYDGWLNKPEVIGENETYVLENTPLASKVQLNQLISVDFSVYVGYEATPHDVTLNLTVKGIAQLNDKAYSIAQGYYSMPIYETNYQIPEKGTNLLLVDWEKTMLKLSRAIYNESSSSGPIITSLLIRLDRNTVIVPWDISTSLSNVRTIQLQVDNRLATTGIDGYVQSNLDWVLSSFQPDSLNIRFTFVFVSAPIFFMAWYLGTTVSDVSFNLRRREIGLLSTKGFSRGQIQRIFLTETLLLGLIGGLLGVLLGFLLNPLFTQFSTEMLLNPQMISLYTIVFTVAFGIIMAFFSTYSSAKKASGLSTVDALREYLPMEEAKAYKKRWSWVAFILGAYKIIVFILGINMTSELSKMMFAGGNFLLMIFVALFIAVDYALNFVGPLLFFWGTTKLLIQFSIKFQELTTRIAKSLGDLGALATKNVRRNPARSAAVAFLIALIVGYGVQVTSQLSSERDYAVRKTYYDVGSDISVYIVSADKAPNISLAILANVSATVENATIEYSLSATVSSSGGQGLSLKAVEPQSWVKTAYYETQWFSGNDATTAFNTLSSDKDTVILERSYAKALGLKMGDTIAFYFSATTKNLRVVGFFGPEQSSQGMGYSPYWSFISEEFLQDVRNDVGYVSARILLKLKGDVNGTSVAENIRNLGLDVSHVDSFSEKWREQQSDIVTVGVLDAQRLGVFFAVLAASVGTALVSVVSMKERSREATIMSVRGLSYKQLVIMFLTENLAIVMFSVILGLFVGLIVAYGNISVTNTALTALVQRRLILAPDATLMLASCLALIFVSTILPILIISRRYVTKLERMARLR